MDFTFVINKNLLLYSALLGKKSGKYRSIITVRGLVKKYPLAFKMQDLRNIFFSNNLNDVFNETVTQVHQLFEEFSTMNEFKVLYEETEKYLNWIKQEWKKKGDKVCKIYSEILKIELPKNVFVVNIVEPSIGGGLYLGNGQIYWGHEELWENYSVVYLVHEYSHSLFDDDNISHAVIELASDNELRIRLGGGHYFKVDGLPIGHPHLLKIEREMYEDWLLYLKYDQTIFDFIEIQQKKSTTPPNKGSIVL